MNNLTFENYQNEDISPTQALYELVLDYQEVESQLEPLEAEKRELRNLISQVVEGLGGKAELAGFGSLRITEPVKTASCDRKALDALVVELLQAAPDIAAAIGACRTESARAGTLVITRSRA